MEEYWKAQLRDCHHSLRSSIIITNILAKLNPLLTEVEYLRVSDEIKNGNIPAVDELVKILLTKDKPTFDRFCSLLDDPSIGYSHIARELRGAPRVGPPPSAGIPKTPPLEEATPVLENLPTHEALQTEQTDATADNIMRLKRKILTTCKKRTNELIGDCPVLRILVVGETGTGKSTLVNNLLRVNTAEEGHSFYSKTTSVTKYSVNMDGISIEIYDTPGLGDSRCNRDFLNLQTMKAVLDGDKIHLVVYCMKLSETRMRESIIHTFQEYTKIGVNWERTVIALTFADNLSVPSAKRKEHGFKMECFFNQRVAELGDCIRRALTEQVRISQEQARNIKCYPTTDNPEEPLVNEEMWYTPLWLDIVDILSPAAKMRFLEIHVKNLERSPSADAPAPAPNIQPNSDPSSVKVVVLEDWRADSSGSGSDNHTVSYNCTKQSWQHFLSPPQETRLLDIFLSAAGVNVTVAAGGVAVGAVTGSVVGGVAGGLVGGPVGVAVGIGLGGLIGGATGGSAASVLGIPFVKAVFS